MLDPEIQEVLEALKKSLRTLHMKFRRYNESLNAAVERIEALERAAPALPAVVDGNGRRT